MSWVAVAIGGAAVVGGALGFFGAKSSNKNIPNVGAEFEKFSGERPAIPGRLREVETQIDDILLKRSLGQDVGFDPERRQALLQQFDISQQQQAERGDADIQNFLSGSGLSRNVAARDALLGRAQTDRERESNKFRLGVDIEDLERRNIERDINTARLQQQSGAKFGQQQARSGFDLDVFNLESQNEATRRGLQLQQFDRRVEPLAAAISGAESGASIGSSIVGGGTLGSSGGGGGLQTGVRDNGLGIITTGNLTPQQSAQAAVLKKSGQNLGRK